MTRFLVAPLAICVMTTSALAADFPQPRADVGTAKVGYVRLYEHGRFEYPTAPNPAHRGRYAHIYSSDSDLSDNCWLQSCLGGSDAVDNNVSSIINYTDFEVFIFEEKGHQGTKAILYPKYNSAGGYWEAKFSLDRLRDCGISNDAISAVYIPKPGEPIDGITPRCYPE